MALALDVTDTESFERFLDDAEAPLGPVDVLVNNAGHHAARPVRDEDDATAQRQVDINVHGVSERHAARAAALPGPQHAATW